MITVRETAYDFNEALDTIETVGAGDLGKALQAREWAEFAPEEYAQRYARLRALMERENLDAGLLTQEENVRYFSGYLSMLWVSRFRPLMAVLPTDVTKEAAVLVSGQEIHNAQSTSWVEQPRVFSPQDPPMPYLADLLHEMVGNSGRVGLELGFGQRLGMSYEQVTQLQDLIPGIELVDITPLTQAVRMLKSPAEVELMRTSSEISCEGVRAGWEALTSGISERDVLKAIGSRMFELGAELSTSKASCFAIMGGRRLTHSNAVGTDANLLGPGDMVLVDGGANYKGYLTDFIRQASLGPVPIDTRRWLDVAIEANHATIDTCRPGAVASDVYAAAMAVFQAHGLLEHNRMTIVGHGIGADIHELPWIGESGSVYSSETTLREGMVLSIEPVLAMPDQGPFGRFIVENVVAVHGSWAENLTSSLSDEVWIV